MHILLVSATDMEIAPTIDYLKQQFISDEAQRSFHFGPLRVTILVTGVGMVATTWAMAQFFFSNPCPDWALNAGICGALDTRLEHGDVVQVVSEQFGDLGIEEADGRFVDLFDLNFLSPDAAPFSGGQLHNGAASDGNFLLPVHGVTVNKVHGYPYSIERLKEKYPHAQVETMESAAFFYACLLRGIPFLALRSVSNYVEPRNRDNWNIPLAISNLNKSVIEMIRCFVTAT